LKKKKGNKIDGWLAIDKPAGMTSAHVVAVLKRALKPEKIGHAGTLDPLATGILPIALGEATKTVPYVMDADKTYSFTVRWGASTASDDSEGEVTATSEVRPTREAIEAALPKFRGDILQVPPQVSAIKVDGERAYDLARAGETFDLKPRPAQVFAFDLEDMPSADEARFTVTSGKGCYMRALARDLAKEVNTLGHITALRRHRVGRFDEALAIPLENFRGLEHSPPPFEGLLSIETALDDIPALALTESEARHLRHGQSLMLISRQDRDRLEQAGVALDQEDSLALASCAGKAVAIVAVDGASLQPVRVFNL
jgi:tRNA pseudouridine55 synthase